MTVKLNAYGKINLNLRIKGKRPDGYHELETVMHGLPLCDTVEVTVSDGNAITLSCNNSEVPSDETNIAWGSAKAYLEAAGIEKSVDIRIEKKLPVAGGFGGSSTDGAATLLALDMIFDGALGDEALYGIAQRLSADMPFCLACASVGIEKYFPVCAVCRGKGEDMTPINSPVEGMYAVLCSKGEGLSASKMYAAFDESDRRASLETKLGELMLFNDFESIAEKECPAITVIKQVMTASGAGAAMMTGSGNGVFGLFYEKSKAEACGFALTSLGIKPYICYLGRDE